MADALPDIAVLDALALRQRLSGLVKRPDIQRRPKDGHGGRALADHKRYSPVARLSRKFHGQLGAVGLPISGDR